MHRWEEITVTTFPNDNYDTGNEEATAKLQAPIINQNYISTKKWRITVNESKSIRIKVIIR